MKNFSEYLKIIYFILINFITIYIKNKKISSFFTYYLKYIQLLSSKFLKMKKQYLKNFL